MMNLEKYVYNYGADSMGIPFFNIIFAFIFNGLLYYLFINLLFVLVYNTNIKRRFYDFLLILAVIVVLFGIFDVIRLQFSYLSLILDFINLTNIVLYVYAIRKLREKRLNNNECGESSI